MIRLALILVPSLRNLVLRRYCVSLNSNGARNINNYLKACNIGDWFLLTQIGQNVDPFFFEDFMQELDHLQKRPKNSENQHLPLNYSNGSNVDTMELNKIHVA